MGGAACGGGDMLGSGATSRRFRGIGRSGVAAKRRRKCALFGGFEPAAGPLPRRGPKFIWAGPDWAPQAFCCGCRNVWA